MAAEGGAEAAKDEEAAAVVRAEKAIAATSKMAMKLQVAAGACHVV